MMEAERALIQAEAILDRSLTHVHMAHCHSISPLMDKRLSQALGKVRRARNLLRKEMISGQRTIVTGHPKDTWYDDWKCDCGRGTERK